MFTCKDKEEPWRWHEARAHQLQNHTTYAAQDMVQGLPKIQEVMQICDSFLVGKQTRLSFPSATNYRSNRALELLHTDLCGPISPATPSHKRYIFVIIDDHTGYMWSILLREKSDAFEKFKTFKNLVEKDVDKKILTLRTDRSGEFTSKEFQDYCNKEEIKRHLTAPYTPQQNCVVERRNRTLM